MTAEEKCCEDIMITELDVKNHETNTKCCNSYENNLSKTYSRFVIL